MRPAGEIRQALLHACKALARPEQAPTLRELAAHARVGIAAAEVAVKNMRRAGVLHVPRTRRVPYRNRPVAEYAPAAPAPRPPAAPCRAAPLTAALRAWG